MNGKWGFIDKAGKTILPFEYGTVTSFNDGVCAVLMEGKWGFIRPDGSVKYPPEWEKTVSFQEAVCPVPKGGLWGLIDPTGKLVLQPKYNEMDSFDSGHVRVTLNGQLMYLDRKFHPIWKQEMKCPAGTDLRMYKAPA